MRFGGVLKVTERSNADSTGADQARAAPALLHPGQLVEYDGESWEVWALEADGTVGLARRALGTRPHFVKVAASELLPPKGSAAA
jgi:hypothetical protein